MLPALVRNMFAPVCTRVSCGAAPVFNSALKTAIKWQVVRHSSRSIRGVPPPSEAGTRDIREGEEELYDNFNYSEIRGSRPAIASGKYQNPKKLKHRQSVGKRVLHLQREAEKMRREQKLYSGLKTQIKFGAVPDIGRHRASPRRIPSNEDIEFYVKRREMRRLLPFKKAANTKQWRMMSNNDKRVDDETIEALQRYKAQKEANPQAKPEPGPLQ